MATSQLIPDWYTDAGKASGLYDYTSFPADQHGFPTPAGPANAPTKRLNSAQSQGPTPEVAPTKIEKGLADVSPLPQMAPPTPSVDMGPSFAMPTPQLGQPEAPQAAPAAAMAGLEAAAPGQDMTPAAGFKQGSAPGGINPNLGRRNLPNDISGLKALTY
jgi:hypothetical protein